VIFHCCFDLGYIIHRNGAAEMAGRVRLAGEPTWATEAEVMAHAVLLRMRGFSVLPTCSKHDPLGHCLGHESEDSDA
jgi:hypothetical protein